MQTVGDYLKKSREARSMSLSDIAEATKITKIYLEYLENNEFKKIPAKPYVKGYISSYAACLGVDPHEALKRYDYFQDQSNDSDESTPENLRGSGNSIPLFVRISKRVWVALAVGMLFVLSIGIYYSFFQHQKEAVVAENLIEHPATKQQQLISTAPYELPPKKQNTNAYQANYQNGHSKPIEPEEVRKKTNNGHSQIPSPPQVQRSKRYAQDAPSDQPAREFAFRACA